MAKKRKRLDCRAEADEVIRLYRVEKQVWKKERLQVIKLLLETEKSDQEVADIVGKARSCIQSWTKLFREGGLESLLVRGNGGGRKSRMSDATKEAMVEKLKQGEFRTAKQFQKWLSEDHQVELSEKGVYYHLGKIGGRLKVPRPSHLKKDENRVKEFRETLADKMKALELPKDKPVKLWVYEPRSGAMESNQENGRNRSENHERNSEMSKNALDEVNRSQITELNRDANTTIQCLVIDTG